MKLVLGFESYPYSARYNAESPLTATVKKRRPKVLSRAQEGYGAGKTSGQVAQELEEKYKIVETFYELEEDFIVELIEEQAAMDIEQVMTMAEPSADSGVSFEETDKIEKRFKQNLTSKRYDGLIPGVPTLASLRGVSHLRQHPYAKGNPIRPSFFDTGLYASSFRAWVEED